MRAIFLRAITWFLGTLLGMAIILGAACVPDDPEGADPASLEEDPSEAPAPEGDDHGHHESAALALDPALVFHIHDLIHELELEPAVTHRVGVVSGVWSDCATWRAGPASSGGGCLVPGEGAVVLIPAGRSVTIDRELEPTIRVVIVRGTLRFSRNRRTRLRVDTVLVEESGALVMGTPEAPVDVRGNGAQARLVFPGDAPAFPRTVDPRTATHGLISEGRVVLVGQDKAGYAFLARDALRDQARLFFAAPPRAWSVGDRVVIPATTFERSFATTQNEVRTITAIQASCTAGGLACVELDRPLAHDHRAPDVAVPSGLPEVRIPVANLDRDVIVETEGTPSLSASRRGHVMLMSNDAIIRGVAFRRLGRTDKHVPIDDPTYHAATDTIRPGTNARARYALHFHKGGCRQADLAAPAVVEASVVEDAVGWGFVNHSSTVSFVGNVAYDYVGAGFVTEDGDEAGVFHGNLAIGGAGTGSGPDVPGSNPDLPPESMRFVREIFGNPPRIAIGDMGFGGHGFWFQGPDLQVTNNIACGNKGAGFAWWADGKFDPATHLYTGFPVDRLPAGSSPQVFDYAESLANINQVGIRRFRQNVAFANFIGVRIRFTTGFGNAPLRAAGDFADRLVGEPLLGHSRIESSTLWGNWMGILASYTRMSFRDLLVLGPPAEQQPPDRGAWTDWQPSAGLYVRGPHVLDFESGVTIDGYNVGAFDTGCSRQGAGNTTIHAAGLRIDGATVDVAGLPPCGP